MRRLLGLLLAAVAVGQSSGPRIQISHTTENLRAVSAVSRSVAWASGTHGTYLRTTDGGKNWTGAQVPGAEGLDFRAIVGFSAEDAFLMSAGPGELSRLYHTSDAGQHWQLQFTNTNPKGFFDSMVFWDHTHGLVLGDPIPDESGKLRFELLVTDDGEKWLQLSTASMPEAMEGEGAFAASNSCLAIIPGAADSNIWFGTGGKVARVFHSADRGRNWEVFDTPIVHGVESAGIFSISFRHALHGVVAGGDFKRPNQDGPNLAFTEDGGKTWMLSTIRPQSYFSGVAYDRHVIELAAQEQRAQENRKKPRVEPAPPQRLFVVGTDFVFDWRPPANPRRIGGKKGTGFNAVSAYPEGGALAVGSKGMIAFIP